MFYIVGNGPSLSKRVLGALPDGKWLGMNSAYRYWEKIDKYPKYYACLDPVVIISHSDKIKNLHDNNFIEEFFLHDEIVKAYPDLASSKKVTLLSDFIADENKKVGFSEMSLYKQTTGALALRFCIEKEADEFCLLGVDCNYVEVLAEAEGTGNHGLAIKEKVEKNPNYFFSDYQEKGDKYQVPNPSIHSGNLHLQSFLTLKRDLIRFGRSVDIQVGSYQSLLYKQGVFKLLNIYDQLKINSLDCIAIPITEREVDIVISNFELWLNPKLYPSLVNNKIDNVHVFLDCGQKQEITSKFEEFLSDGRFGYIVRNFKLSFLNLPDSVNYYLKVDDGSKRSTKSGPNIFWLSVMKCCEVYDNTLQIESDCLPIRGGWFDSVNNTVSNWNKEFWIMGPQYFGPTNLDMAYILHINGNAIYATGNSSFQTFLDDVYVPLIKDVIEKNNHTLAYDTAFSYLLLSGNRKYINSSNSALIRNLDKFIYGDFILNLGGRVETENAENYDITKIINEHPGAVLGHGRLFNRQVPKYLRELESFYSGLDALQSELFIGGAWISVDPGRIVVNGFDNISYELKNAEERFVVAIDFFNIDTVGTSSTFEFTVESHIPFLIGNASLRMIESHDKYHEYQVKSLIDNNSAFLTTDAIEQRPTGKATLVLEVKLNDKEHEGYFSVTGMQKQTKRSPLIPELIDADSAKGVIAGWESFITDPRPSVKGGFTLANVVAENLALIDYKLEPKFKSDSIFLKFANTGYLEAESKATFILKGRPSHENRYLRVKSSVNGNNVKLRICRFGTTKWEYNDLLLDGKQDFFIKNPFTILHDGLRVEVLTQGLRDAELQIWFVADSENRFGIDGLVNYLGDNDMSNASIACEVASDVFLKTSFSAISKSGKFSYLVPRFTAVLAQAGKQKLLSRTVKHIAYIDPVYRKTASATQELRNSLFEDYCSEKLTLIGPSLESGFDWEIYQDGVSSHVTNKDFISELEKLDAEFVIRTAHSQLFDINFYKKLNASNLVFSYFHMDLWDRRLANSAISNDASKFLEVFKDFLKRAKGGFAISERMKVYISKFYEIEEPSVVHNFPKSIIYKKGAAFSSYSSDRIRMAYVGGLEADMTVKGLKDFLNCLASIQDFPVKVDFFIKTFSRHRGVLTELLELHSESWFTLTGDSGDYDYNKYNALLEKTDLLFLTYNNDDEKAKDYVEYSFPNKFADYLSAQKPLIYYGPDFAVTDYIARLESEYVKWISKDDSIKATLLNMLPLVGTSYPAQLIDKIQNSMGESIMKSNFYSKIY